MELRNIVMVGPVYPYKGGISHYTCLMCRALSKKYKVRMVSYKMQYPRILFKKEQRDYSSRHMEIPGTEYLIHTANPFNILRSARRIRKNNPDLVIIQWWHPYFAPCYWLLTKFLGKTKVLFVCHNVFPHERFLMDHFLTKLVLRQGDLFLVQSESDAADLLEINPNAIYKRTVHPIYNMFRMKGMGASEARHNLQISEKDKMLLFFGFVRPYKGLKYLLEAMPQIRGRYPEVQLFVVGDFDSDKNSYQELIRKLNLEACVQIRDGYIPDSEVEPYFAASDLIVLPYESATQSGIVQIAYGFQKPVVATRVGGLPEAVIDGCTGYLSDPCDPHSLAEAVIRFFDEDKADEFSENVVKEAEKYSWERLTEAVEELWNH